MGENPHWEVIMFRNVKVCASIVAPWLAGIMAMPAAHAAEIKETYNVVAVVQLPAGSNPLVSADIAWVDEDSHAYGLADRSNKAIDIIDTRKNDTITLLTANCQLPLFALPCPFAGASKANGGHAAAPNGAGPNGVIIIERKDDVWAADGPVCPPDDPLRAHCTKSGSLKNIDLKSGKMKKVVYVNPSDIPLTPPNVTPSNPANTVHGRVDEFCYNPASDLLLAGSNASAFGDSFITFINEDSGEIVGHLRLDGSSGKDAAIDPDTKLPINANSAIEQCQANPRDGKFYLALPDIGGGSGAVLRISAKKPFVVEKVFHINSSTGCAGPAGLTIGPDHQMLVGCNGTSTNSVILYDDGRLPLYVQTASGVDEVWFDPGSNHYYLAQQNAVPAIMGVEDAGNKKTLPSADRNASTQAGSRNPAADPDKNFVYLPVLAPAPGAPPITGGICSRNTDVDGKYGDDAHGCIAIYSAPLNKDDRRREEADRE
jgi:hypothetical protein